MDRTSPPSHTAVCQKSGWPYQNWGHPTNYGTNGPFWWVSTWKPAKMNIQAVENEPSTPWQQETVGHDSYLGSYVRYWKISTATIVMMSAASDQKKNKNKIKIISFFSIPSHHPNTKKTSYVILFFHPFFFVVWFTERSDSWSRVSSWSRASYRPHLE